MKYVPREIQAEVNYTPVHPLVNLGHLLGTVAAIGISAYIGLGIAATQIAIRIGPDAETKVGNALFTPLAAQTLPQDPRLPYLQNLAESLVTDSLATRPPVTLHILDDPLPNAFVMPGGHILFTTGLLDNAKTENEIAFVLAHELGHHATRDSLRRLGRSLVLVTLTSTLSLGGVQLPSPVTSSSNLADLHYSRSQESAADRYALAAMIDKYGHGQYGLDFFTRM
ncbi:MAG: M48 family metallopeptidase, partial [Cyanobacteria bacterium P01_A01_bin.105]